MACIRLAISESVGSWDIMQGCDLVVVEFNVEECLKNYPVTIASDLKNSSVFPQLSTQRDGSKILYPPNITKYSTRVRASRYSRNYSFTGNVNKFNDAVNSVLRSAVTVYETLKNDYIQNATNVRNSVSSVGSAGNIADLLKALDSSGSVVKSLYDLITSGIEKYTNRISGGAVINVINNDCKETAAGCFQDGVLSYYREVLKPYLRDYVNKSFVISLRNQVYLTLRDLVMRNEFGKIVDTLHDNIKKARDNIINNFEDSLNTYTEFYKDSYDKEFNKYLKTETESGNEYVVVIGGDELIKKYNELSTAFSVFASVAGGAVYEEKIKKVRDYIIELSSANTYLDRLRTRAIAFRNKYKDDVISRCNAVSKKIDDSAVEFSALLGKLDDVVASYNDDMVRNYIGNITPNGVSRSKVYRYLFDAHNVMKNELDTALSPIFDSIKKASFNDDVNSVSKHLSDTLHRHVYFSQDDVDKYQKEILEYYNKLVSKYNDKNKKTLFDRYGNTLQSIQLKKSKLFNSIESIALKSLPVIDIVDVKVDTSFGKDITPDVIVKVELRNIGSVAVKCGLDIVLSVAGDSTKNMHHRVDLVNIPPSSSHVFTATIDGGVIYKALGDVVGKSVKVTPNLVVER